MRRIQRNEKDFELKPEAAGFTPPQYPAKACHA
jgi:hypothetical protein